jgi:hypothetical protein
MRAILVNLSRKIAKFQTNVAAPNGPSQANIWQLPAAGNRTFRFDSAGLNKTPALEEKSTSAQS